VLLMNPVTLPVWLAGLAWFFTPAGRRWRALGWCYLIMFVSLLLTRGKVYYLAPVYPMLLAAGAIAWERLFERRRWVWLKPASVAVGSGRCSCVAHGAPGAAGGNVHSLRARHR